MTTDVLIAMLAEKAMGWKVAPDRYIKPGRGWLPRWRFQPLTNLHDAFQLVTKVSDDYSLICTPQAGFTAEVRINGQVGIASSEETSRAITLAVARALGINPTAKQ